MRLDRQGVPTTHGAPGPLNNKARAWSPGFACSAMMPFTVRGCAVVGSLK